MISKETMEKECIQLAGNSYLEHMKKGIISSNGNDAWDKVLPSLWQNVKNTSGMVDNTSPNGAEITNIKKVFSCLFARGNSVIDVNRAEEITLDVMGNLIAESNEFTKMMQLYMTISSKKDVGIFQKVFQISNPDFTVVPNFHKIQAMNGFIKSKGYEPRIVDSARQIFPYEYNDKKTGNIIDCIIHFYL